MTKGLESGASEEVEKASLEPEAGTVVGLGMACGRGARISTIFMLFMRAGTRAHVYFGNFDEGSSARDSIALCVSLWARRR